MITLKDNKKYLYQVYRICGEYLNSYKKEKYLESISIKDNYWPEYNFNINKKLLSEKELLKSQISAKKIINKILFFSDDTAINKIDVLNLKKTDKWHIMNLEKNKPFKNDNSKKDIKIKKLSRNEIYLWNDFIGLSLDFVEFLYDKGFIFYALFYKELLISTSLFYVIDDIANIFMVGTKNNYRKNGFASLLMKENINEFIKNNINKFCLQSTDEGKKLYESIGFIKVGEAYIFNVL